MLRVTKKMKKCMVGGSAILLTAVIATGAVLSSTQTALAANPTLPGVEEIIYNNSNENSFVILEIVPDKKDASLGLFIGGEEPVDATAKSIKDMPSTEERLEKFTRQTAEQKITALGIGDAVSYETYAEYDNPENIPEGAVLREVDIRGEYVELTDNSGNYTLSEGIDLFEQLTIIEEDGTETNTEFKLSTINADATILYREHRSFYLPEEGETGTSYGITLKVIPNVSNPKDPDTPGRDLLPYELDGSNDVYNNQFFVAEEIEDPNGNDNGLADNDLIFQLIEPAEGQTGTASLEFVCIYNTTTRPTFEDGKFFKVEEADGDNVEDGETYYYVSAATELQQGSAGLLAESDFVAVTRPTNGYVETVVPSENAEEETDYVFIGNKFYIYKDFNDQITYAPAGGNYRFRTDYAMDPIATATYAGGFTNQEWFKKYVFDLTDAAEFETMSIDVVTVTPAELSTQYAAGEDVLADVGLIYFAGTSTDPASTVYTLPYIEDDLSTADEFEGLSVQMAQALIGAISEGVPTVVNRSVYANDNNDELIRKVAACLMHNNPWNITGIGDVGTLELNTLEQTMAQPLPDDTLTYVNGHIYVHDDLEGGNVLSANFHDVEFTADQIAGSDNNKGFAELIEEIENENFYLELAGKKDKIPEKATVATAIRHILNSGDRRNVTKSTLRVLDLEPYDFEKYYQYTHLNANNTLDILEDIRVPNGTQDNRTRVNSIETDSICISNTRLNKTGWIIDNIAHQFEGKEKDIDVTIMGTKEFVGKIDDLNEKYDLIYLGMDTSIMNTTISNGVKTNRTVYNDSSMNGLVYTHVGDVTEMNYRENNRPEQFIGPGEYRMPGNDITPDKLRELKEYIEAGYAMIISDDFLVGSNGNWNANAQKVDISSNMYTLINEVILAKENGAYRYFGKNVNTKGNIETASADELENFSRYLGIAKLVLEYEEDDLPTAWNQPDGSQPYLQADASGVYHLEFDIKLKNDAAVGVDDTTYDCQLFIDVDADGRYEETEILTGLSITDSDGDEKNVDDKGHFNLTVDDTYHIERELPEGYTGFISWKLLFNQNGRTYDYETANEERSMVRSSIIGYSAVKAPEDQKPTIRILQIGDERDDNLHASTAWNGDYHHTNNLDLDSPEMHVLYEAVTDFNIEIDRYNAGRYVRKQWAGYDGESYTEFLNSYDMVVVGFGDSFRFGDLVANNNGVWTTEEAIRDAMLAIRAYALSGRSIMFTHDLTQPISAYLDINNSYRAMGWYADRLLRDIQGMDRFGWLNQQTRDENHFIEVPADEEYQYESVYDTPVQRGKTLENVGFTGSVLAFRNYKEYNNWGFNYNTKYGETSRRSSWDFQAHHNYYDASNTYFDESYGSYIGQVNKGQITEYPYKIDENFEASHTHAQYLQLNLDTDSRDANNNDDIVVWYALTDTPEWEDSYFRALEMDARNNYFIFSKGNVIYTGSGDKKVTSEMERKLFVNTLVASYRAGIRAPRAAFKENEWKNSATIETMYVPYDSQLNIDASPEVVEGGFLDEQLQVYFYTSNVDLKQSSEAINARYYTDGDGSADDVIIDGKAYDDITDQIVKSFLIVEENGTLAEREASATVLNNNTMYSVLFNYDDVDLGNAGGGVSGKNTTNIYIRLGYDELKNDVTTLSATESISKLNVVCTQLFELR